MTQILAVIVTPFCLQIHLFGQFVQIVSQEVNVRQKASTAETSAVVDQLWEAVDTRSHVSQRSSSVTVILVLIISGQKRLFDQFLVFDVVIHVHNERMLQIETNFEIGDERNVHLVQMVFWSDSRQQ